MAETAKILNPSKKVLLPDLDAGCSLSDSCPADKLAEYKEKNPDLYVVAYVQLLGRSEGFERRDLHKWERRADRQQRSR